MALIKTPTTPEELAAIAEAVKLNSKLELKDMEVYRRDNGEIVIDQGDWVILSESEAIQVAEFILFGKNNTTITLDVDDVPMTAVVLQGDYEKHQLARLKKKGDE